MLRLPLVLGCLLLLLPLAVSSSAERGSRLVDLSKDSRFDEVAELAREGADEFQDGLGNTPLIYASKNGHIGAVVALLSAGFSIAHRNNDGESALDLALQLGDPVMLESILDHFWRRGTEEYLYLLRLLQREGSLPLAVQRRLLHLYFINAEFDILSQGAPPL